MDCKDVFCKNQIGFHQAIILPLCESANRLVLGKISWMCDNVQNIIENFSDDLKMIEEEKRKEKEQFAQVL